MELISCHNSGPSKTRPATTRKVAASNQLKQELRNPSRLIRIRSSTPFNVSGNGIDGDVDFSNEDRRTENMIIFPKCLIGGRVRHFSRFSRSGLPNRRHDPIPLYLNPADGASPGLPRFTQRRGFHPLNSFSSHCSRTLITDLHPNRCEDTSTMHYRELRQSPETNAFPAANFSPLFDNIWPRSAHPQVHAKSQNFPLSPIF
jgi:hypothetical protein